MLKKAEFNAKNHNVSKYLFIDIRQCFSVYKPLVVESKSTYH